MGWKIWCHHGFAWVFFPSQNHPACMTMHIVKESDCHPIYDCLMGKQLWHLLPLARSVRQCFPHSSSLHPPGSILIFKCFIFSLERSAADFIPGSHRRGSHQNPVLSLQRAGRTSSGPTVSHFNGIQCQWDHATLMLPGHQGQ